MRNNSSPRVFAERTSLPLTESWGRCLTEMMDGAIVNVAAEVRVIKYWEAARRK
jgi:hypothetical protein